MRRGILKAICTAIALLAAISTFGVSYAVDFWDEIPYGDYQLVYGDVNLDGAVATGDATVMLRYCTGLIQFSAMQYINGDVNCDSEVNTADAGLILKHIAGIIISLPFNPSLQSGESDIVFRNNTFPKDGDRLPFGRSYGLNGLLISHYAFKSVTIKITDIRTNEAEIQNTVVFPYNDSIYYYNTQTSEDAIDNLIRFSSLSTGKKKLELFCSTAICHNALVYEAEFNIGYTFEEIAPYCYDRGNKPSATEARCILSILNSLDYVTDSGAKIISAGTKYLGTSYSEMDCSYFVLSAVKGGLAIKLPRTSVDQALYCERNGLKIDASDRRAGDLIFFRNTECHCGRHNEIHHSAVYLGQYDGVDYLIESASGIGKVVMRRLWGQSGGSWVIDSMARVR